MDFTYPFGIGAFRFMMLYPKEESILTAIIRPVQPIVHLFLKELFILK